MSVQQPGIFLLLVPLMAFVMIGCAEKEPAGDQEIMDKGAAMEKMPAMEAVPDSLRQMDLTPLVPAYYESKEAFFIHTATSHESVAEMLTQMMGPEVIHVPKLADLPEGFSAPIYVFENGMEGIGPLGYQRDVLSVVPGEEGYRPFAQIHLVSWNAKADPQELRSVQAIEQAAQDGWLSIEPTDRVVNAPVLAWPGGHR